MLVFPSFKILAGGPDSLAFSLARKSREPRAVGRTIE